MSAALYPSVTDPESSHVRERGLVATLRGRGAVPRTVVLLGLTSLFTDVSSEALTAVLPLYLALELRMTPLQFGLLDGLYQGASALVRVASGLVADRFGRLKAVAFGGYALSAACKPALLVAGAAWGPIAGVLLLDRLGKGVRTAPRDALIARATPASRLGEAFGLHRSLDALGALLGPVLAFAVLAAAPGAYDAVFVASFAAALVGLAILGLFVADRGAAAPPAPRAGPRRLRAAFASARFRTLVAAGGLLGLATISDALLYLLLQRRGAVSATAFPLLFVGTAAVYLLLARRAGRLADRFGRARVFLAGHALALAIYGLLLTGAAGPAAIVACVALLGAYYAATDGVLAALASAVLDEDHLATGLAVVSTVAAIARLVASTAFGALWSWRGPEAALAAFALALAIAIAAAAVLLRSSTARPAEA